MSKVEKQNIWTGFLDGCSKRVQNQHGTTVIIGDTQCGKTDLVLKLCADKNLSQQAEEEDEGDMQKAEVALAQKELLSYDYFYIDDDDDTTDDSRVNVWSFNDHMFEHAFDIVGRDSMRDERLVFIICVDLGNPEAAVKSLEKWLYKAAAYFKKFFAEFPERAEAMRKQTVNYVRNAREFKGLGEGLTDDWVDIDVDNAEQQVEEGGEEENKESESSEVKGEKEETPVTDTQEKATDEAVEEEEVNKVREKTPEEKAEEEKLKVEENEKYDFIQKYFGVPIIVVGCKSDLIAMDDLESVRSSRELQAKIRTMCLDVGAALIYSSTFIDTNIATMKKYIEHRLYPENLLLQDQQGELEMEDKINETFIPAGFDTLDLIKYSTGLKEDTLEPKKMRENFNISEISTINDTSVRTERKAPEKVEIELEQEWLGGLYSFVTQVSGGALYADVDGKVDVNVSPLQISTEQVDDEVKEEKVVPKKTAKPVVANTENVGDFFKNLLSAPSVKK